MVNLVTSPLAWYLLFVLIGLLLLRPSKHGGNRRSRHDGTRRIANILIGLTLLLGLASTPMVEVLLERSLRLDRVSAAEGSPEFIIVLGGSYVTSTAPEEDVLNTASARRLLHGVNEWRSNTQARLVLSGNGYPPHLSAADLMARDAADYDVPDSLLVVEPLAKNTREHPTEVLRLPGVTSTTHVAVVTSGWHMRRARREFCRYFERIDLYPVPPVERVRSLNYVVPRAGSLSGTTRLVREWVGIVWYAIRGIGIEAVGDC